MVFSRETSNKIFFIVEKVKGDFLETKSDIFKSKKYYEIYQYFNYISTNLNLSDMNIAKRSFKNYFILYNIYLLLIALKKPNLIINLLKSVPGVYLGFSKLLFSNDLMLVMRDIGSEGNIFIDSNKATLIDLENLTITNKYAFFTSIILANSNNSNFLNLFLGTKNMEKLIKSKTELDIFKSLLLYSIVVQFLDDIENGIKNAESTHNLYDSVLGLDTSNYFLKEINKKYENRKTEKELISNKLTAQYVQ
jgi:hypothetical protein